MKILCFLSLSLFLYSCLPVFSQESFTYKGLSVAFPAAYRNKEAGGINAFYANKDSVSYQVMIIKDTSTMLKADHQLAAFLEGVSGSFLQSAGTDFQHTMVDTTIGGAKGRFVHVFAPTSHHVFKEAYVFFTALLNQPYAIQLMIFGSIDDSSKKRIRDFYNSVKFKGKQFQSN